VDTPGILDHSLEDRNTIEMQVSRVRVQSCSLLGYTDTNPVF
jgi:hypothetical protein